MLYANPFEILTAPISSAAILNMAVLLASILKNKDHELRDNVEKCYTKTRGDTENLILVCSHF